MSASERILAALGEGDRSTSSAFAGGVEPVVVHGGAADFGTTLTGAPSISDVQDLIDSGTARVKQLAQAYADFSPTWVAKDSAAFVDWTNDWTALQTRWNNALKSAQDAVALNKVSIAPASMSDGSEAYAGMMKALKQGYPPDGAPMQKGDFDDLYQRLNAATGTTIAITVPQPKAIDVDLSVFKATSSADVVAMATGAQKPSGVAGGLAAGPLGALFRAGQFIGKHPVATQWVLVAVAGGLVLGYLMPVLKGFAAGAKGVAALAA